MTKAAKLTRLLNADNEVVGYFSDHVAAQAARAEWEQYSLQHGDGLHGACRSVETYIKPAELENVNPGDGDRADYILNQNAATIQQKIINWGHSGAASVEVQRYLINRYRRPGMSSRDADLGGPTLASGVLYVLTIKTPK